MFYISQLNCIKNILIRVKTGELNEVEELISFWQGVHISGICVHPQEQDFSFHTQLISLLPPFFRQSLFISPNFAHFHKVRHDENEDYGTGKYHLQIMIMMMMKDCKKTSI